MKHNEDKEAYEHASTGICPTCPECQADYGMEPREFYSACKSGRIHDEPHFSWSSCDWCGCALGGDREVAHAIDKETGKLVHFDGVCVDCILESAGFEVERE